VDDCCGLTHRTFQQLASADSAIAMVGPLVTPEPADGPGRSDGFVGFYAQDLELVTVTDTSFILTWFTGATPSPAAPYLPSREPRPVPTDGVVRYGTDPDHLDLAVTEAGGETAHHYVEIPGLRPGTRYYYRATSGGVAATSRRLPELTFPDGGVHLSEVPGDAELAAILRAVLATGRSHAASPGSVTTLVPPPGRHLFTLALSNDLHTGEAESGLALAHFPPGFSQAPGLPPYPVVMGTSMVDDAAARGADVLLVAGDLTSAALPAEVRDSRALLDRFGTLTLEGRLGQGHYVVARGNHDQPKTGPAYAACPPVGTTGYHDCLPAVYDLPQGRLTATEYSGLRLVGLDTTILDGNGGAIDDQQFAALRDVLNVHPEQPTLVFGHHPVTDESAYTTIAGPGFDLNRADAARLEALYSVTPGVFLHHAGHTHRNLRTASPMAQGVEFLEVAAIKEYPGGFTLLQIYEGGYMANFYKSSAALARQWSQTSSGEYLGLYPAYTLGGLADRNHVVDRDFSTLQVGTAPGTPARGITVIEPE
jgi:3',5'-cyclic-AMP phosphodiesterase